MTRIFKKISRITAGMVVVLFGLNMLYTPVSFAQVAIIMPPPGQMVHVTRHFEPPQMVGLKIDLKDPFSFNFIMDQGESPMSDLDKKEEFNKIIKYFLVSLAMPNKEMWVNLSPYESSRIIPAVFGQTEMGRDLLAQDYILKQFTASLMYPEDGLGKKFWNKVYQEAQARFGTTNINVNTFNKVWIVADKADVYQKGDTAFLVDSHLKVMLEQDYLALSHTVIPAKAGIQNKNDVNALGAQIVREIIIPAIEKEVNEGKSFAAVRQVYNAEIMATWFKKTLRESLLGQVFADRSKIAGQKNSDPQAMEKIYKQYLSAYKKGVFNYIKEDAAPDGQMIPRKYFSGGLQNVSEAMVTTITSSDNPEVRDFAMGAKSLISRTRLFLAAVAFTTLAGSAFVVTPATAQTQAGHSVSREASTASAPVKAQVRPGKAVISYTSFDGRKVIRIGSEINGKAAYHDKDGWHYYRSGKVLKSGEWDNKMPAVTAKPRPATTAPAGIKTEKLFIVQLVERIFNFSAAPTITAPTGAIAKHKAAPLAARTAPPAAAVPLSPTKPFVSAPTAGTKLSVATSTSFVPPPPPITSGAKAVQNATYINNSTRIVPPDIENQLPKLEPALKSLEQYLKKNHNFNSNYSKALGKSYDGWLKALGPYRGNPIVNPYIDRINDVLSILQAISQRAGQTPSAGSPPPPPPPKKLSASAVPLPTPAPLAKTASAPVVKPPAAALPVSPELRPPQTVPPTVSTPGHTVVPGTAAYTPVLNYTPIPQPVSRISPLTTLKEVADRIGEFMYAPIAKTFLNQQLIDEAKQVAAGQKPFAEALPHMVSLIQQAYPWLKAGVIEEKMVSIPHHEAFCANACADGAYAQNGQINIAYGIEWGAGFRIAKQFMSPENFRDIFLTKKGKMTREQADLMLVLALQPYLQQEEDFFNRGNYFSQKIHNVPAGSQSAWLEIIYQMNPGNLKTDTFKHIRDLTLQGRYDEAANILDGTFFNKYSERVAYYETRLRNRDLSAKFQQNLQVVQTDSGFIPKRNPKTLLTQQAQPTLFSQFFGAKSQNPPTQVARQVRPQGVNSLRSQRVKNSSTQVISSTQAKKKVPPKPVHKKGKVNVASDRAMLIPGGISLSDEYLTINIKVDGAGMPLPARFQDKAMMDLNGLTSIIRRITPLTPENVPALYELVK